MTQTEEVPYTLAAVSREVVVSPRTVRTIAAELGIQPQVMGGHYKLFSRGQVEQIRAALARRFPNHNFRDKMRRGGPRKADRVADVLESYEPIES